MSNVFRLPWKSKIFERTDRIHHICPCSWIISSGLTMLPSFLSSGLRPERLDTFSNACWDIMTQCWHGDPSNRPLLGIVENKLREIQKTVLASVESVTSKKIPSKNDSRNMKWYSKLPQNQCWFNLWFSFFSFFFFLYMHSLIKHVHTCPHTNI